MENVAARRRGAILEVPAAPHFRLEKEIKNIITVVAKTSHYWLGHIPDDQQRAIAELFNTMAAESPLVEPDFSSGDTAAESPLVEPDLSSTDSTRSRDLAASIAGQIQRTIGLQESTKGYAGWVGVECPSVHFAVWMMRALVATNVLARREEATLFVPVNAATDPRGSIVASAVERIYTCASARGVS
jgi:hypothetical protein